MNAEIRQSRSVWPSALHQALFVTVIAVAILVLLLSADLATLQQDLRDGLEGLGLGARLAFLLAYVVASCFFLPVFPLDLAAGACFGFWEGVLWVQLSAMVGACFGHQLGRGLMRGLFDRMIDRRPGLRERVLAAVDREGAKIVFLSRLSPIFSFTLLNGLFGAARVDLWRYLAATFVGILPGTLLYVSTGVVAGDLSLADSKAGPLESLPLQIFGLAITVLVVCYVTRCASRALKRSLEGSGESAEQVR